MGQVIVRNLDDEVVRKLKQRAADQNKSLEQFLRDSLGELVRPDKETLIEQLEEIRRRGKPAHIDAAELIRMDRDTR